MKPDEVVIDYETYYDKEVSIKTLGIVNYAKRSDAYIVSIVRGGAGWCGEIQDLYGVGPDSCPTHLRPDLEKDTPIAANAGFDTEFWNKSHGKFKKPWKCVLDIAAGNQLPRDMAGLSKAVLNSVMDKGIRTAMEGKQWKDLPDDAKKATKDYCLNDGYAERDCYDIMKPLSPIEDKLSTYTRMTNRRGITIDTDAVEKAKNTLEIAKHQAFLQIPWQEYAKPLSYDEFAKYCGRHNVKPPESLDKSDEECNAWIKANPGLAKALVSMRTYRKSNTMLEKIGNLLTRLSDGVLPMELLYCGAPHTRRWSSRGFNVQNLEKEGITLEIPGVDASETTIWPRKFLVPRPGHSFVILDLSQIEPRCLSWWVGDDALLNGIRKGYAIYEAYARANMGWKGGKLKTENPKLYSVAKASVLGAGYGCGPDKFRSTAKTQIGLDLTLEEAKQVVDSYRLANPLVIKLWRTFDNMITQTIRAGGSRDLEIEMPTGEVLKYWRISPQLPRGYSAKKVKNATDKNSIITKFWGGVCTENVIQRMARDVLAEKIIQLEEDGLPVLFSSHDEVILEVDNSSTKEALEYAIQVLRVPPEWASDLPLDCEGGIHSHYTK